MRKRAMMKSKKTEKCNFSKDTPKQSNEEKKRRKPEWNTDPLGIH